MKPRAKTDPVNVNNIETPAQKNLLVIARSGNYSENTVRKPVASASQVLSFLRLSRFSFSLLLLITIQKYQMKSIINRFV